MYLCDTIKDGYTKPAGSPIMLNFGLSPLSPMPKPSPLAGPSGPSAQRQGKPSDPSNSNHSYRPSRNQSSRPSLRELFVPPLGKPCHSRLKYEVRAIIPQTYFPPIQFRPPTENGWKACLSSLSNRFWYLGSDSGRNLSGWKIRGSTQLAGSF